MDIDRDDSQNLVMLCMTFGVGIMCYAIIGVWLWQLATNATVNPVLGTLANVILGGLLKIAGDATVAWVGGGKPSAAPPK